MHWPISFKPNDEKLPKDKDGKMKLESTSVADTWAEMEKLVDAGKCKAIGISNFNEQDITDLLKTARHPPAVHQLETHPYLQQHDFIEVCQTKSIRYIRTDVIDTVI